MQEKDEDAAYMSHVQRHGTGVDFKYRGGGPANEAEVRAYEGIRHFHP